MKYCKLGPMNVCKLGMGGSHLSSGVKFDPETNLPLKGHLERVELIKSAIRQGVNYIDIAPLYGSGRCEVIAGLALKDLPRESFFIATKVGRNHDCEFDYSADGVLKSFKKSLKNLQIDYVDVLHIHDVEFAGPEVLLNETLPTLNQLRKTKQIRHLGIAGYDLKLLKSIVERSTIRIDFVQSYCKYVLFNDELLDYLPFFKEQNISVINSAPLAMSLLTNSSQVPTWHPADERVKRICLDAGSFCKENNVNLSRLAINFCFSSNHIGMTLIGFNEENLLQENIDLLCNGLTENEKRVDLLVKERFFSKAGRCDWNGIEAGNYRKDQEKFVRNLRATLRA